MFFLSSRHGLGVSNTSQLSSLVSSRCCMGVCVLTAPKARRFVGLWKSFNGMRYFTSPVLSVGRLDHWRCVFFFTCKVCRLRQLSSNILKGHKIPESFFPVPFGTSSAKCQSPLKQNSSRHKYYSSERVIWRI